MRLREYCCLRFFEKELHGSVISAKTDRPSFKYTRAVFADCQRPASKSWSNPVCAENRYVAPPLRKEYGLKSQWEKPKIERTLEKSSRHLCAGPVRGCLGGEH